jgi:hypothetical protein
VREGEKKVGRDRVREKSERGEKKVGRAFFGLGGETEYIEKKVCLCVCVCVCV